MGHGSLDGVGERAGEGKPVGENTREPVKEGIPGEWRGSVQGEAVESDVKEGT